MAKVSKKQVFKVKYGRLPGLQKATFCGFILDDKDEYKAGGMYAQFIKQFNNSGWEQCGYTVKEFREQFKDVENLFNQEAERSRNNEEPVVAEACFEVELWGLSDCEDMLDLLKAAVREGKGEADILDLLNGFVKKLKQTKESVAQNNPRIKYNLSIPSKENRAPTTTGENLSINKINELADKENEEKSTRQDQDTFKEKDMKAVATGVKTESIHEQEEEMNAKVAETALKEANIDKEDMEKETQIKNDQDETINKDEHVEEETIQELKKKVGMLSINLESVTIERDDLEEDFKKLKSNKDKLIDILNENLANRESEILKLNERIEDLEGKIREANKEFNEEVNVEALNSVEGSIEGIKDDVKKILKHLGDESERTKKGVKRKFFEIVIDVEEFVEKHLKRPSIDDLKGKIKDNSKKINEIASDVKKNVKLTEDMATHQHDKQDEIIKLLEKLEVSCEKTNGSKNINPVYMSVPNSDKIAFVGDKLLHYLMHDNTSFRYDLMSGSYVKTGLSCFMKDLVRLGSNLGQWMATIPKDLEWLIMSFGLDDTLNHPFIEKQKNQSLMIDTEELVNLNQVEMVKLAEKLVGVAEAISANFPTTSIIYILPPPSESEPCVMDHLRKELKLAWQRGGVTSSEGSKLKFLDCAECLTGIKNFEMSKTGSLTWPAALKVAKEIYCTIFPASTTKFSDCCSSLHVPGTCNKDIYGSAEKEFGSDGCCRLCNSRDHILRNCTAREHFRKERINCGHCGSLAANLSHHPDICRDRFSRCSLCNMNGHNEAVHRNAAALRIASDRLGKHGIPFKQMAPAGPTKKSAASGLADIIELNGNEVEYVESSGLSSQNPKKRKLNGDQ